MSSHLGGTDVVQETPGPDRLAGRRAMVNVFGATVKMLQGRSGAQWGADPVERFDSERRISRGGHLTGYHRAGRREDTSSADAAVVGRRTRMSSTGFR